jgi:diguanylate cyclase
VPPLPRFYELFYVMAHGELPALQSRVRELFASGAPPLTDGVERLYNEFIATPVPADRLHDVSGQLSETIAGAQAALGSALGSVTDYSDTLADASSRLADSPTEDGLRQLTQRLHDRTRVIASENHELRQRLEAAQSQIGTLHQPRRGQRRAAGPGVGRHRPFQAVQRSLRPPDR